MMDIIYFQSKLLLGNISMLEEGCMKMEQVRETSASIPHLLRPWHRQHR